MIMWLILGLTVGGAVSVAVIAGWWEGRDNWRDEEASEYELNEECRRLVERMVEQDKRRE